MTDMVVWYIVLLVGTACIILGVSYRHNILKRANLEEVRSEDLDVIDR